VSKTQFLSEHGKATKLASSSSLGDVRLMSSPLTAHDVRKQPGLTSICGMSDVVKVSVIARSLGSTQHAFFIAHRRRPLNFFYDYFIARTRFEGTLEYDNTKIVLFTAVLLLSISFNLWDKTGTDYLDV
jgi:hypothetical protein